MKTFKRTAAAFALTSLFSIFASAHPVTASGQPATASPPHAASGKAAVKAERKQQRTEARARKNAELKKLEGTGYRPGESDPDYPQNIEKAEKKSDQATSPSK